VALDRLSGFRRRRGSAVMMFSQFPVDAIRVAPVRAFAMIRNLAAYHFVSIDDADVLVERLRARCIGDGLMGTILVAGEGINCFLAGSADAISAFVAWLKRDARFAAMAVKYSDSATVPFKRLRVKRKREIITFRHEGIAPEAERAPAVSPGILSRWLQQGADDDGRALCLLDTRNAQEVAYGTFEGALTLPIGSFTQLPEALEAHRDSLRGKTIVSFCTGGVRCEKSALWMRDAGYENVLQLDGGILGYFEQVGGFGYRDRCFVFDERVALDPQLRPLRD
jgi:UPF0176 protein